MSTEQSELRLFSKKKYLNFRAKKSRFEIVAQRRQYSKKLALQNVKCLKIGRLFMPKSEKSGRCYDHKMNVCV